MYTGMPLAEGLAEPVDATADGPRYTVEPATGLDGSAMYALRDIKTQRVVKFYRSLTVARGDARFLNAVRPPLPLG